MSYNPFNIPEEFIPQFKDFAREMPPLSGSTTVYAPQAWFLGPKAENLELFSELTKMALKSHVDSRTSFQKGDAPVFDPDFKKTDAYKNATGEMKKKSEQLFKFLSKSLPYSSFRYLGHMISDVTIPSVIGYISTILYNPNNVTIQASPATTYIELVVGNDLCRMVGFPFPEKSIKQLTTDHITPRGHLTSGGTVANTEAFWSLYWSKFVPVALKEAIAYQPLLSGASNITVTLANGTVKKLCMCSAWELINLSVDEAVGLPYRVAEICSIDDPSHVTFLLKQYHPSTMGVLSFFNEHRIREPCFMAPGTSHYSIPKASAILGLGSDHVNILAVDKHGRMDLLALRAHLDACLVNRIPVVAVVAVLGTTEETAVDDLAGILEIRKEYRLRGLNFGIHTDAAWGGYFLSCIRPDYELEDPAGDVTNPTTTQAPASPFNNMDGSDPALFCSQYFRKQLAACAHTDTITIDPHKTGYIPYPAGAICFRNSRLRDILVYTATYIGGGGLPSVGIYGIEGSKPGAAASAVYLSHAILRTSKSGYGMILKRVLLNTRIFYLRLLWLAQETDNFIVHGLPNPPSSLELAYFKKKLVQHNGTLLSSDEICKDVELVTRLAEIGPDQNIVCYGFNFKTKTNNQPNTNFELYKKFNQKIYERFDYIPEEHLKEYDLILSNTEIGPSYGPAFGQAYTNRVGLVNVPINSYIPVLRSTIFDVFARETTSGSAFDKVFPIIKQEVTKFANEFKNLVPHAA